MSAIPKPTAEDLIEDWIYFHLSCAKQSRGRLARLVMGTPDYGAENYIRHRAIEEAKRHLATLAGLGYPLSPELREAMAAEGLA